MLSTKINNTLHLWFWVDHLIFGSFIFTDFLKVILCRSQNKAKELTLQLANLVIYFSWSTNPHRTQHHLLDREPIEGFWPYATVLPSLALTTLLLVTTSSSEICWLIYLNISLSRLLSSNVGEDEPRHLENCNEKRPKSCRA